MKAPSGQSGDAERCPARLRRWPRERRIIRPSRARRR